MVKNHIYPDEPIVNVLPHLLSVCVLCVYACVCIIMYFFLKYLGISCIYHVPLSLNTSVCNIS